MVPSNLNNRGSSDVKGNSAAVIHGLRKVACALLLGILSLAAPGLLAQYSTTKFIDPNTFPATVSAPSFNEPIATDGTYTAIVSTDDSVWSKTVAGGTPKKLFSPGTNLPSSSIPATVIYGGLAVTNGQVVFYAAGAPTGVSSPTLYGIYSVAADGSAPAVRVADSGQVCGAACWEGNVVAYGAYGVFAVGGNTVVFTISQAMYSAGTDGSNLKTLWLSNAQNQGCSTAGQDAQIFVVDGVNNPATDGTNFAYAGSSTLDFVSLYTEPLGTVDGCNSLITSGLCNICGPVSTLPGQPQDGTAFAFDGIVQIDGDYVYFMADAKEGVSSTEDYYGIFKVPMAGGAATAVVTNLSHLPLLEISPGVYDEPGFGGYAVRNGKLIFFGADATINGTGQFAFYMVQGDNFVPVFTNQTSINNQCTGNMTGSNGINQPALTTDGHLYFPANYVTTGPDLNGSCDYAFLRFQPYAYYVVDTTHPLIPAQTAVTMTPTPASVTTSTPVTLNVAVGTATGASNPGSLVPTGTVNVYYTSPQVFGVQNPGSITLDDTGKGTLSLGNLEAIQYNFTVSYGGDSNFTQSGSNAIALDLRPPAAATMATPATGSVLTGSTQTFTWTAGAHVNTYQLNLSAYGPGGYDLYTSGHVTTTSATVTGLPTNGETVYARLYSVINGVTSFNDYTYTAASLATLTSPAPGSALKSTTEQFVWSAGSGVTQYDLHLSAVAPGGYDLYSSGHITGTSTVVTKLPTNGETIYARLYSVIGGVMYSNDYTYTAVSIAKLNSPAPGSTLTSTSEVFKWSAGTGVTQYDLHLSAVAPGDSEIYSSGHVTRISAAVSGLPANGETLYARLYSVIGGATYYNDYTYTSGPLATLISPAPGSTLTSTSVVFTWSAGSGVTQYDLHLSAIAPGDSELYSSGHITRTAAAVSGLPANGATIYARLYSVINGVTSYNDYTYKAK